MIFLLYIFIHKSKTYSHPKKIGISVYIKIYMYIYTIFFDEVDISSSVLYLVVKNFTDHDSIYRLSFDILKNNKSNIPDPPPKTK